MAARSCVGLSCCFPSDDSDLTSSWSGATEENRSRKHHDDGGASVESDQPLPRSVNLLWKKRISIRSNHVLNSNQLHFWC